MCDFALHYWLSTNNTCHQLCTQMSRRPAALHLYLHTPLGPACAVIAPSVLRTALAASQHEDAVLETLVPLGTVTEPHLWSEEAPGFAFEAAVRCRVVPHRREGDACTTPAAGLQGGGWRHVVTRLADGRQLCRWLCAPMQCLCMRVCDIVSC